MPQCLLRVARFRGIDRMEFLGNRQFNGNAFTLRAPDRRQRRVKGMPMSLADSQIAGIAKSRDFALATLNVHDFRGIGLVVLQPR